MKRLIVSVLIVIVFCLLFTNPAFPQRIKFIPISANKCFDIEVSNTRDAKEHSVVVDLKLVNLKTTWFLGVLEKRQGYNNVSADDQIPIAFLIGPNQEMVFKNIEFTDEQVLFLSFRRDDLSVTAILTIDLLCRGLFGEPLSQENFFKLNSAIGIEGFEAVANSLGKESTGLLLASMAHFADGDIIGGTKGLANFVISTKKFKQKLWDVMRLIFGENNSIINTSQMITELEALIKLPERVFLLTPIARDSVNPSCVADDLRLVAFATPCFQLVSPVKISPVSENYYVGDVLRGEFTIKNIGINSIKLKQLTIGGRGPDNPLDFQDFTCAKDIQIDPNKTYSYSGNLTLKKPGKHYFRWVWQDTSEQWKNRLWFENWLWQFSDGIIIMDVGSKNQQKNFSTKFQAGDCVRAKKTLELHSSLENVANNVVSSLPKGCVVRIVEHPDNGIFADGCYWWRIDDKWCCEDSLELLFNKEKVNLLDVFQLSNYQGNMELKALEDKIDYFFVLAKSKNPDLSDGLTSRDVVFLKGDSQQYVVILERHQDDGSNSFIFYAIGEPKLQSPHNGYPVLSFNNNGLFVSAIFLALTPTDLKYSVSKNDQDDTWQGWWQTKIWQNQTGAWYSLYVICFSDNPVTPLPDVLYLAIDQNDKAVFVNDKKITFTEQVDGATVRVEKALLGRPGKPGKPIHFDN